MAGPTKQRVFIHYVLGKMLLLFFLCHPGTLATCDGQAYLRNRYANRDLVKTEAELEDHRRHYKPRDASEFTMRIGVPDEILHGDVTGYTPDWTPTLEQRFRDTVMSWLRKGRAPAAQLQQQQPVADADAAAITASPASARAAARGVGLMPSPLPARGTTPAATAATRAASGRTAFVSSPHALGSEGHRRYAREIARQRWMSITEVGRDPRERVVNNGSTATRHRGVSALARRCSVGGCPGYSGSGDRRSTYLGCCGGGGSGNGPQMLLGRFRNRGVPLRRGIFGGGSAEADVAKDGSGGSSSSSSSSSSNNSNYVQAQAENDQMAAASPMAPDAFEQDPELVAATGSSGAKSSVISSLLGGAADAYDSALSFVGCALVTSPLGKRYLSGASDGYNTVSTIRRTGGGPADVSSGSAYDLVGFSNIDPFEASGRGGGRSNRLLG